MSSVYIIIPAASITQAMINRSVNKRLENMRSNTGATSYIVEVEKPVPSLYDGYQWCTESEMLATIEEDAEWQS